MIPALVLTAGLATRLRPLSLVRAKAALPLGGLPIAARILQRLSAAGVTDAVLNLHHLAESLVSRIGDGSEFGIRVRYSWESPHVLGSAGGPRKALPLMGAPRFLIVNGDTLTDFGLDALLDAHASSGALVTMAVVANTRPEHYGGLAVRDDAFTGIIPRGSREPSFHFIGVQVVEADAFAGLENDAPAESVRSLYPALVAQRPGCVRIHRCESSFLDIGTPRDYFSSCRALAPAGAGLLEMGTDVRVAASAVLDDCVLWDRIDIQDHVALTRTIVTDDVVVPAGSRWADVILRRAGGPLAAEERQTGDIVATPVVFG